MKFSSLPSLLVKWKRLIYFSYSDQASGLYSGRNPSSMECFFLFREVSMFKSVNPIRHSASPMDFTYCAHDTKETQWTWQRAHLINHCWNQREFCCGSDKRPQPALVPSPDKMWLRLRIVYCSVMWHISCWPCTEVTDAHGHEPGLGLPGELVQKGLDYGGKAIMGMRRNR